jgi:hypothetical protein
MAPPREWINLDHPEMLKGPLDSRALVWGAWDLPLIAGSVPGVPNGKAISSFT